MLRIVKFLLGTFLSLFIFLSVDIARADLFGMDSTILTKMLVEDVQQNLHLADIYKMGMNEFKLLNERYGYQKWINKGLDEVKDYGLLQHLKTDDFIIGTLQHDFSQVGFDLNADTYNMENLDEWISQIWDKSPEIININTKYPGSLDEWNFQAENNLPGVNQGFRSLHNSVNRKSAYLSYKQALWNMKFTEKSKQQYKQLLKDVTTANPGKSTRLTAQSNAYQNFQLAKINNTQSSILRLMAEKKLNKLQDDDYSRLNVMKSFSGLSNMFKSLPTLMQ